MEGVVAKRLGSPYRPGVRSPDWVKLKHWRVEEFAVGGWLPDREGGLRAILLGRPVRGGMAYAGAVEFGFSRTDLQAELQALAPEGPAPKGAPSTAKPVRPVLMARVRYQSLTESGRVRGATVVGFHR
jgi:bifunctional non-homologous end joining protein LigD